MNPTKSAADFIVGLLPSNAPEWAIGAAVMAGIWVVLVGMLAVAGVAAWVIERRAQ